MSVRTMHEGDMYRRPDAYFRVIAGAALLALVSPACDSDDSTTSTTDSAVTVSPTVASTVAPTSTIGAPVGYPGQATYVSGLIEDFNLDEGTVTDEDNGASRSRDGTVSYTMVANDPRVSGTLTGTWNSDRWGVFEDGALVQWGDVVLTNDDGSWEGSFAGAYASDYGGDILTRWIVGRGAYEGLTFYFWLDTPDGSLSGPWYGLIYPGEPPPNVQQGTASTTSPSPTTNMIDIPAEYAHPEVLAEVDWMAAHLQDPSVRIIDARVPMEASLYATGHIPGAVYIDVFQDICCPSKIMSADEFAHVMAEFGIGDSTTVVVYDADGGLWATRLWWALRYYGHDDVKLLNGGLRQWVMAGQPLETASPVVTPAVFTPKVVDHWRATIDEVRQAITDPAVALVDALPQASYTGDLVLYGRGGHIPTAVNLPYSETVDGIGKAVLDPATLARMLERRGLDPSQRVITYCGGGNAGSNLAFVLYLMGFDNVGLYDGSLGEWTQDSANPMETVT